MEELKAVEESSKAVQEISKLVSKLSSFLEKAIGGSFIQLGGTLEDWTRYLRYKNLLKIKDKVDKLHRKRGLEGKTVPIPLRSAIPMLEAASYEDNQTLQALWANLIANSMDPKYIDKLHPAYIEIVKQLTPDEAIILQNFTKSRAYPVVLSEYIHEEVRDHRSFPRELYASIKRAYLRLCSKLPLKNPKRAMTYLDNLIRLQLVELVYESQQTLTDYYGSPIPRISANIELTLDRKEMLRVSDFGENFIKACIEN